MVLLLVLLCKQFANNLVFLTWAFAAGFNNNKSYHQGGGHREMGNLINFLFNTEKVVFTNNIP